MVFKFQFTAQIEKREMPERRRCTIENAPIQSTDFYAHRSHTMCVR